jgi:hypothetical protein
LGTYEEALAPSAAHRVPRGLATGWSKEDEARRAAALAENRPPPELGLIVYKGKRVATVKRAFRRIGTELGLMGFSQYSLRHFMAAQIKKLFRNVPREQRSLWMGARCA